jgi:hypothetical protein
MLGVELCLEGHLALIFIFQTSLVDMLVNLQEAKENFVNIYYIEV